MVADVCCGGGELASSSSFVAFILVFWGWGGLREREGDCFPRRVEVRCGVTYLSWDRFRALFYSSSADTVLWKRLLVAAWAVADMFVVRSVARCWLIAMAVLFCRAGKLVGISRDSWLRGMCGRRNAGFGGCDVGDDGRSGNSRCAERPLSRQEELVGWEKTPYCGASTPDVV